jgi:hypothetical protein
MQIGLAIHGSDALLFGLAFPDPVDNFIAVSNQVRMNAHPTKIVVGSPVMATTVTGTNKKAANHRGLVHSRTHQRAKR